MCVGRGSGRPQEIDGVQCLNKVIRAVLAQTDLGAQMVYSRQARAGKQWQRLAAMQETMSSISILPLQPEERACYVRAKVFPSVLYRCESMAYSEVWVDQLRTATARAV